MKTIRRIVFGLRSLYCYIVGNLIVRVYRYEKRYLTGRWFSTRYGTVFSQGWRWITENKRVCRRLGVNKGVPWAISPRIQIVHPENISFHPDDLNNFQSFGNYFQGIGSITIGRGTYIAPNVGIITSNHTIGDLDAHDPAKPVNIGEGCWIGMNAVILPGVELGPQTTVGAGAVVTKSFPEGFCVIAGNPAKVIRTTR